MTTLPNRRAAAVVALLLLGASTVLWGCGKKEAAVKAPAPQTMSVAASPAPGSVPPGGAPQTTVLKVQPMPPAPGADGGPP